MYLGERRVVRPSHRDLDLAKSRRAAAATGGRCVVATPLGRPQRIPAAAAAAVVQLAERHRDSADEIGARQRVPVEERHVELDAICDVGLARGQREDVTPPRTARRFDDLTSCLAAGGVCLLSR